MTTTRKRPKNHVTQPNADQRAAFETTRLQRDALAEENLLPVNVDVHTAASIAIAAISRVRPLAAALGRRSATPYALDDLLLLAEAADYANALWLTAYESPDELGPLVAEAQGLRTLAVAMLRVGVAAGITQASFVEALRGGTGYGGLTSDLFAAENEFRANWSRYEGKLLTTADLDSMRRVATMVNARVSSRRFGTPRRVQIVEDRRRAFTLLVRAYEELRRDVTWLRWHEADADRIAPSLWTRAGGGRRPVTEAPTASSEAAPSIAATRPTDPSASAALAAIAPQTIEAALAG